LQERTTSGDKMNGFSYDDQADAIYINLSSKRVSSTLELNPRINVDLSESKKIVGVEILEACSLLSDLFHKKVSKDKIKSLLYKVSDKDALYVNFELKVGQKSEYASLAIPKLYRSPVLGVG